LVALKQVLIADRDDSIREFVVIYLHRSGYETQEAKDGSSALEIYRECGDEIDIVIAETELEGIDGLSLFRGIRSGDKNIGLFLLTEKAQEVDRVAGFLAGADDYLTKPFSPSELIVRIDALYRRVELFKSVGSQREELESPPFLLNPRSRSFLKNGNPIDLTQVEFQIVKFLLEHQHVSLSRKDILKAVWGDSYFGDQKIVDVNIRRLRLKLEDDPSQPKYITTLWGFGYKWGT
jgi:two-component system response regulator RegX3